MVNHCYPMSESLYCTIMYHYPFYPMKAPYIWSSPGHHSHITNIIIICTTVNSILCSWRAELVTDITRSVVLENMSLNIEEMFTFYWESLRHNKWLMCTLPSLRWIFFLSNDYEAYVSEAKSWKHYSWHISRFKHIQTFFYSLHITGVFSRSEKTPVVCKHLN